MSRKPLAALESDTTATSLPPITPVENYNPGEGQNHWQ
jgi:hypothetical protein